MFCNHPERCRDDEAHEKLDKLVKHLGTFFIPSGGIYRTGVSDKRIEHLETRLNLLAAYFGIEFVDEPPKTVIHKKVT